jgi:hypothetical protein
MNKSEMTRHALQMVGDIFDEYVAFPSQEARDAVVLWTLHTHVYEQFESTPRLGLMSNEPGSGKSRVLELLEHLTPDPMLAVNYHPAVLWRQIAHSAKTTLLLDEVDTVFGRVGSSSAHMSLRSILNAGHRAGATVKRCAGTEGLVEYNVFAPCALAGLGDLPETIATRSIIIRMKRRSGSQTIRPFRYRFARAELTRAKLTVEEWAENVGYLLGMAFPEMPVQDRAADVWEPLFAIAEVAGGPWPQRVTRACIEMNRGEDETQDAGQELLTDILTAFQSDRALFTRELLERLYADPQSVWTPELLDSRKLARALSEYGIAPTTVRRGDEILKGYKRETFDRQWSKIGVTAFASSVTGEEETADLAAYDM